MSIHILLYASQYNFNLLRHAEDVRIIFTTFFAVPTIRYHRVQKMISRVEFTYPPMSGWNLSHASSYCCPFLLSADRRIRDRLSRSSPNYSPFLEQSVFGIDTWMALYRVADYALSNYRRGRGLSNRDGLTASTRVDLLFLARMAVQLLRKNHR